MLGILDLAYSRLLPAGRPFILRFCGFEVGMIRIATKHAFKLIASAISFIPFTASRTMLRCLPGVFPFHPHSCDLATPFQQIYGIGVLPMRQPSIHFARKRSALAIFNPLEVLDGDHFHIAEVNLFDLSRQFFFDLSARVFLSFVETLNLGMQFLRDLLAVRENQAVSMLESIPTIRPSVFG